MSAGTKPVLRVVDLDQAALADLHRIVAVGVDRAAVAAAAHHAADQRRVAAELDHVAGQGQEELVVGAVVLVEQRAPGVAFTVAVEPVMRAPVEAVTLAVGGGLEIRLLLLRRDLFPLHEDS